MRSRHVIYWPKFSYFPFAISTISTSSLRKILRLSLLDNFFFNFIRKEKLRQEKKRKQTKNFFLEIVAFARLWYAQPHPHTHTHKQTEKRCQRNFRQKKSKTRFRFLRGVFSFTGGRNRLIHTFQRVLQNKKAGKGNFSPISMYIDCTTCLKKKELAHLI